ncbi:hypothetical protein BJ546DRAFT_972845 [Cryomyces antarcticus]
MVITFRTQGTLSRWSVFSLCSLALAIRYVRPTVQYTITLVGALCTHPTEECQPIATERAVCVRPVVFRFAICVMEHIDVDVDPKGRYLPYSTKRRRQ